MTVGDCLIKIQRYKELYDKLTLNNIPSESLPIFESLESKKDYICSGISYLDLCDLIYLLDKEIDVLKELEVKDEDRQ